MRLARRTGSWGWPHQGELWKHSYPLADVGLEFHGKRGHGPWTLAFRMCIEVTFNWPAATYHSPSSQACGFQIPCRKAIGWFGWLCLECGTLCPSSVCHERPWQEGAIPVNLDHSITRGSCGCDVCNWGVLCSLRLLQLAHSQWAVM